MCGSLVFGSFRLLSIRGSRKKIQKAWVGAGQASQWETWLLKKGSVHKKEMLGRSHRCKFSSNIVNVKWVSHKKSRLQTGQPWSVHEVRPLLTPSAPSDLEQSSPPAVRDRSSFGGLYDQPKFSVFYTELIVPKRQSKIKGFKTSCKKSETLSWWYPAGFNGSATRFNFSHQFKTGKCAHCVRESASFISVTCLIGSVLSHSTRQETTA